MANKTYQIVIPETSEPLVINWARFEGWRPTIVNTDGQEVENPVQPIQYAFNAALRGGAQSAITMMATEAAELARQQAAIAAQQMVNDIVNASVFTPVEEN